MCENDPLDVNDLLDKYHVNELEELGEELDRRNHQKGDYHETEDR